MELRNGQSIVVVQGPSDGMLSKTVFLAPLPKLQYVTV